jgi:hypothetical protein
MGDWSKVVLDDLATMSQQFEQGHADFAAAAEAVKAEPVDTGDGTLNDYLAYVTGRIEELTIKSAELIQEHAGKVKYAHDSYERHDIDNEELFEDMDFEYKH